MYTKQLVACVLLLLILVGTLCNARYNDDNSEEVEALDTRRAVFDALLQRSFQKRTVYSCLTILY